MNRLCRGRKEDQLNKSLPKFAAILFCFIASAGLLAPAAQDSSSVAVVYAPDAEPIIVPRAAALAEYRYLSQRVLVHEQDKHLFNGLVLALSAGDKSLLTESDPTHAERVIEEWKRKFSQE